METRKYNVYSFDELSEESKETAIERFREHNLDYQWWDSVYEDAKEIGKLMGIGIDNIYFSGFYSQGDGACFEGSYEYVKGSSKAVKDHAPQDAELFRIAVGLSKTQRPFFYQLSATVKHNGYQHHEHGTEIRVYNNWEDSFSYTKDFVDAEDTIKELLRDFMRWIYKRLETEHDWLQSDEQIIEMIKCNEYMFAEDGRID